MPFELNNPALRPFAEIPFLALAIRRADQFVHVGLLYRNEAGEVRLSDLAFHYHFRGNESPDNSYFWLEPSFNEMLCELVAGYLVHIAEENAAGQIPYSIVYRGKSFDETGKYVGMGLGTGLTCATYVLDVLGEALQIPLIAVDTWPPGRAGDGQWAETILAMLVGHAPQEHIDAQRAVLTNVVRYRPEEVGAAFAMFKTEPLSFEQIEGPSLELLAQLPVPPAPQPQVPA